MTDHGSYTYDDSDRRLTIREMGGRVDIFVRDLDDSAMVLLPAEQRQAAAQALAGDGYRVVPADQIDAMSTDGRVRLYPSQPDRPAPVDPSEVRVGDVVEIEGDDGSWMVRGPYAGPGMLSRGKLIIRIGGRNEAIPYADATVRILRRAEPGPDPELLRIVRDVNLATWDSSEEYVRELERRGVRLVDDRGPDA